MDYDPIIWDLAEEVYGALFRNEEPQAQDETGRKWYLREFIARVREEAVKPYKEALAAKLAPGGKER